MAGCVDRGGYYIFSFYDRKVLDRSLFGNQRSQLHVRRRGLDNHDIAVGLLFLLDFFLGAEFTQVYATQYGSGVAPTENAQPIAEGTQARKSPPPERRGGERGPRPRGDQTDRPGRRVGRSH